MRTLLFAAILFASTVIQKKIDITGKFPDNIIGTSGKQIEPCPTVSYKPLWRIDLENGATIYAANAEKTPTRDSVRVTYQFIDTDDCKIKTVKFTIKSTVIRNIGLTDMYK